MACRCTNCGKPCDCGELYCTKCLIENALKGNREIKLKDGTRKIALYDEEGDTVWVNVKDDAKMCDTQS